jgi:hypothetical protein
MTVPVEAWPVPGVVQAPLNYRVKGDEKRVVYMPTPDAAPSERSGTFEWGIVKIRGRIAVEPEYWLRRLGSVSWRRLGRV